MNKLNAVKRLNERVADIKREYGETYYQDIELRIRKMLPEDLLKTTASGAVGVKQGKGALEQLSEDTINKLLALPTRGGYTKELKTQYKAEYGAEVKPKRSDLAEFDKLKYKVKQAAEDGLFTRYGEEGVGDTLKGTSGQKSYTHLARLIDEFYKEERAKEKATNSNIDKIIAENQRELNR